MLRQLLSIVLFFTFHFSLFAQKKFNPGFVLINSGDTLRGEIDFVNSPLNPDKLVFRSNGEDKKYSVADLAGFGLDEGVFFTRFSISYQEAASELRDATNRFDGKTITQDAWLRLLFRGSYSLYELGTPKRNYYFIFSASEGLKELIYRLRVNNNQQLEKDEQYKNLLSLYALQTGKEKQVNHLLERADFKPEILKEICAVLSDEKSSTYRETAQTKTTWDVSAGVIANLLHAGGTYNGELGPPAKTTATFDSPTGVVFSTGITVMYNRSRSKIQTRFGVNVYSLPIHGQHSRSDTITTKEIFQGGVFVVEPTCSLDWAIFQSNQTRFLVGLQIGYNIIASNSFKTLIRTGSGQEHFSDFPVTGGGFIAGGINATLTNKRSRFHLQVLKTSNIFDVISEGPALSSLQLALTYGIILKK